MSSNPNEHHVGFTQIYKHINFLKAPFPFTLTFRNADTLPEHVHAHDFFQICYVIRGTCLHTINECQAVLCKGDFFSIPPYMTHRLKKIEGHDIHLAQIDFLPSFLQEQLTYSADLEGIVDFAYLHPLLNSAEHVLPKLNLQQDSQQQVEQMIATMQKELELQQPMHQLAVRAELLKLLIVAGREFHHAIHGKEEHRLFQSKKHSLLGAITYMETHFAEELELVQVAEKAYMSPAYFSSIFKAMTGQNFTYYLNALRVNKAQELLKTTDMPITDIYLQCGFNNASHFIEVFKKHTGLTPSAYRKHAH
ncbi:AraC family transcriptional regulator [Paenibacillus oryzisoli]|uniref:helix-turn-helix domain-containing protein n=1 Tax=Paenibacillus oryzisoli TaxID=1850517 RepID=UPI003D268C35